MKKLINIFTQQNETAKEATIVFGLSLVLKPELKTEKQVVDHIQDTLYGDSIGASGNFRLMVSNADLINYDFACGCDKKQFTQDDWANAVQPSSNATIVNLVIGVWCEEGFDIEIDALTEELNHMIEKGYAIDWSQININPKCLKVEFDVDTSSCSQIIEIVSDLTREEFCKQLNSGEIGTSLDINDNKYIYNVDGDKVGKVISQSFNADEKKNFSIVD